MISLKKLQVLVYSFFLFGWGFLIAQNPMIEITGIIIEAQTNQPIEYATVSLIDNGSNQVIDGAITSPDGTFGIKTKTKNFHVKISFIGFETKSIKTFNIENNKIDLKDYYSI